MALHNLPAGTADLWFANDDEAAAFEFGELISISTSALPASLSLSQITDTNGLAAAIVAAIQIGRAVTLTAKIEVGADEIDDFVSAASPNRWGIVVLNFSNGISARIGTAISSVSSGNFGGDATVTLTLSPSRSPVVTAGDVLLSALSLSNADFTEGDDAGTLIGAIVGKTSGSTVTVNPSDARVAVSGNNLVVGSEVAEAGVFDVTLRETYGAASNSPRDTVLTITVDAAAPTLSALTLSADEFTEGDSAGTFIGTISGKTSGSTLNINPSEPRVALSGNNLVVGSTPATEGSFSVTVRETLAGATNTPRDTTFPITVNEAAPTLAALALSDDTFSEDDAAGIVIGAIQNKTSGSTLSIEPADGRVAISGTNLVVGLTPATEGDFDITIRETLAGATNTPRDTTLTLTVEAGAPVLGDLALSGLTFSEGDAEGTVIGTISGKTSGSTLSVIPNDGRFAISGTNLVVGASASTAGDIDITIVETLAGAVGSPKDNDFTITVEAGGIIISNLPIWSAALNDVQNGIRNARLFSIGDSTTMGSGANSATFTANDKANSYPTLICDLLTDRSGLSASSSSFIASNNVTDMKAYDSRITFTSGQGWNLVTEFGSGGHTAGGPIVRHNTTSQAKFNFAPSNQCDTFEFYYLQTNTTGAWTTSINDVDKATLNINFANNNPGNFLKATSTAALGSNVFNVRGANNTNPHYMVGVVAYNSAVKEITVLNAGWYGARTADWNNGTTYSYRPIAAIAMYEPDLCIINLGINDANDNVAEATYKANMQAIITACINAGSDVVLVVPNPIGNGNQSRLNTMAGWINDLATTNGGLTVIDLRVPFVDYATANAAGWMRDTLHPNAAGYAQIAEYIADAIAPLSAFT